MDDVFETVDREHFALTAFVRATDDSHFVVFADGDGSDLCEGRISDGPERMLCDWNEDSWWQLGFGGRRLTLCLSRSSLLRGALMITRRTLEGALKWAFLAFLREEWRAERAQC